MQMQILFPQYDLILHIQQKRISSLESIVRFLQSKKNLSLFICAL